jgi:hypothetical protein
LSEKQISELDQVFISVAHVGLAKVSEQKGDYLIARFVLVQIPYILWTWHERGVAGAVVEVP